ncbi:hypothetical protein BO94DRAFT_535916 [Aspergillus sclerotioniger CBS 115572]|uniref:Uncharacterized protein n=1 Tax=Aspergillus sclerotioniger CBS 115572 TaxID=1450535 RepID=A0A317WKG5_9EURO|nr:hypothetical protein BO94DRAFT_535916 [Aspergillus sclerotioniger CBS 115572]PWY85772.1 hypothetical protein BO94DRAFT_535916 [Aspergillus sclerotioniger CBS 115572]
MALRSSTPPRRSSSILTTPRFVYVGWVCRHPANLSRLTGDEPLRTPLFCTTRTL